MHRERLTKLAALLRQVDARPDPRFNLATWATLFASPIPDDEEALKKVQEGATVNDFDCGTTACAIGHACLDPWFQEQGLHLAKREGEDWLYPSYGDHSSPTKALAEFFDIAEPRVGFLFLEVMYPPLATAGMVADRIEQLLMRPDPN